MSKGEAISLLREALRRDPCAKLRGVVIKKEPARPGVSLPVERLRELYEAGMGCPSIASLHNTSESTVRRRLLAAGVRMRYSEGGILPRNRPTVGRAASAYESGLTQKAIGDNHGVSRSPVRDALLKGDVEARSPLYILPVADMAEAWRNGASTAEIADALGISDATVSRRLDGVIPQNYKKVRGLPEDEICEAYRAGCSIREIAGICKVGERPISQALRSRGIRPLKKEAIKLPEKEICEAYRDGRSIRSLADEHKTSTSTIRSRLLARGVKLRTRGRQKKK